MKCSELYNEYLRLLEENRKLKEENDGLKKQLGLDDTAMNVIDENNTTEYIVDEIAVEELKTLDINNSSSPEKKIELFMSLFKGRDDIYARHWTKKDGKSNYSPVCLNEWKKGLCEKPRLKGMK